MNWWDLVRDAGDAFLAQHGVLAAFVYLAVEEAGVPIPVPGDFLMLTLGVRAREGGIALWQVIAAMEAGTVLGSTLLYLLARRGGRGVVERYGRFIGIKPEQLDRAQAQLNRHGALAVFLGRLLPGLRVVTAIACGIFCVPFRVFFPAMALGGLIYIFGYTLLGYFAGPAVFGVIEALHLPVAMIGSGLPLLLLVGVLILIRRGLPHPMPRPYLRPWHRARVGLLAGVLASAGALLSLDLVVAITGDLAWRLPDSLLAQIISELSRALARRNGWPAVARGAVDRGYRLGRRVRGLGRAAPAGPGRGARARLRARPVHGRQRLARAAADADARRVAARACRAAHRVCAPGVLRRDSGARVPRASSAPSTRK